MRFTVKKRRTVVKEKLAAKPAVPENAIVFEEDKSKYECVICLNNPKDTVMMPCKHMCCCSSCYRKNKSKLSNCPICRKAIKTILTVFT